MLPLYMWNYFYMLWQLMAVLVADEPGSAFVFLNVFTGLVVTRPVANIVKFVKQLPVCCSQNAQKSRLFIFRFLSMVSYWISLILDARLEHAYQR